MFGSFSEYQLPEILRTPLQSLCLQIKSLKLGSISEFLSRALQSPELLAVGLFSYFILDTVCREVDTHFDLSNFFVYKFLFMHIH